jgi:putative beta-lysine N-acetyltransferase
MDLQLPGPADPTPRWRVAELHTPGDEVVVVRDDAYSDRIRCDHPAVQDGEDLGQALLSAAKERDRGRVVVLCERALTAGLERAGFWLEAVIPGFYSGAESCLVLGASPAGRPPLANPQRVGEVDELIDAHAPWVEPPPTPTERAGQQDSAAIAALIAECVTYYPTPSGHPGFIEAHLATGAPFRVVRDEGRVVACACADLVPFAAAAELTDCFTAPSHRRRGLMRALLSDLMGDLAGLDYRTAYTLCRATSPGINLAFKGLAFDYCGRMSRSCRIGEGLEDMNIWSRTVPRARARTG